MKLRKIGLDLCLLILIIFLVFVNIGLNISGPARYNEIQEAAILEKVNQRFPLIQSLYRHNFEYVTYSAISAKNAYVFDYEGGLVMKKEFDEASLTEIQNRIYEEYGVENAEVHIGYGYDNMAYIVDEDDFKVYFDYDTKEEIFYWRSMA